MLACKPKFTVMALAASDTEGLVVFKTESQSVCNTKNLEVSAELHKGGISIQDRG